MIHFINSIGQRKVSKLLLFFSIIINTFFLILNFGIDSPLTVNFWTGLFLMSTPVGFLYLTSHNTRKYRLYCITIQSVVIITNIILFTFEASLILFILTLVELIVSIVLYIVIKINPEKLPPKISKNKKSNE